MHAERSDKAPHTWLLLGDKLGDNSQVRRVAEALPWSMEERSLTFYRPFRKGKPPYFASTYHVDKKHSDALAAPWPDLILTIGRRCAMVADWIVKQAQKSGGPVPKVVLFGRPKRAVQAYDLVVAPIQYALPDAQNVVHLDLPLIDVDRARIARAKAQWADRLADLPRPLTALFIGGATQPYTLGAAQIDALVHGMAELQDGAGGRGTWYFTTSRRTGSAAENQLMADMPEQGRVFLWNRSNDPDANPYLGLLAHADRFVVTGDSVSMLMEVARLRKPLAIFELPLQSVRIRDRLSQHFGRYGRDLGRVHRALYKRGLAVPFGQSFPALDPRASDTSDTSDTSDGGDASEGGDDDIVLEVAQVVQRIEALFDGPGSRVNA